ncbi:POU domain, class 4, transcription factor 3 [Schistosoma japonicum]|uniref:POU domain protein n=1 Tax=Schistosoma japonicum TaxID=6182 RepID=A0A4Z2DXL9_SCHJA|nr:POU domain, class 4, transcription factor 3 [Schistosoma japonicum]
MINTFNTETYCNTSNNNSNNNNINKHEIIKCSSDNVESNKLNPILAIASHQWFDRLFQSNSYTGNNYQHQSNHSNPRLYNHNHHQTCSLNFDTSHDHFEQTQLNSNYSGCCQTSEDNLLTTQTVINNLELTRFSEMHYCDKSTNDNTNSNNTSSNEIHETNDKMNICAEIDFNNSAKYGFNSSEEKSPINSNQLKSHSSNLDYQNEIDYDRHQFTNYSNYMTEFDKNELTKMENKQHVLTSDERDNSNAITCSNDSSNFCSNRLRTKLTSELSDNTKKSHFYFDEEYKTKNINESHRLNQAITTDKSYLGSFQSKEINDDCLNAMPKNNNNFRLYNLRSSTTPLRKSSSSSPHQTNSQKMLNNEIITTTSLLEWHLTPESSMIEKIKPDNNNNEQLLLNYKSRSSDQSSDSMYNDSLCVNDASKSSNQSNTYEKLISQTADHSPPLSYSSQSTEHVNEDSLRSSHQHLHSQSHHVEKLHSNFNNECTWKANNFHSDFLSFDNEINYIKNHWSSSHNLLMNKLRFSGNLTTQTTALPVVGNNSNNEVNSNEQNSSFDSMIPCISHNFLTNFTRTPYDPPQSNSMHENLYGLSSSHLNTNGGLMGSFTNTSLFNIDDSSHHVSPPINNHNKLDDEYDRTEHCVGTYNHSHHHDHHHTSHNQFMTMNNCGNCNYNFQNDVTSATSTTTTNFKTSLNCYLLPPINGFNVNSVDNNQSQLTDGGVSSNFKTRLNSSSGYSSQNFPHSTILGCNHSNAPFYRHPVELDYNPRELEAFSELFKQRRIKLGVTQADVGKALGNLKISGVGSLSQSTICRFESLTLSHNNMVALKPVLQAWLEEAEAEASTRLNHPSIYDLEEERRRKRTSITDSEKRSLEAFFSIQPRPSSEKIAQIAEKLNLKKNVVRVWFCNQRQKQKRMKFSTLGMLHHSVTRT